MAQLKHVINLGDDVPAGPRTGRFVTAVESAKRRVQARPLAAETSSQQARASYLDSEAGTCSRQGRLARQNIGWLPFGKGACPAAPSRALSSTTLLLLDSGLVPRRLLQRKLGHCELFELLTQMAH